MTGCEFLMIKLLDKKLLNELGQEAESLPRRRKNLNLHHSFKSPVQKLFNAMQVDSYVRPHRHPEEEKTELFIAVRGRFAALIFDENGTVTEHIEFSPDGEVFGAEIKPNTWHTVIALEDGSVFFEVKQGPYTPLSDKDFAAWAPEETSAAVKEFMNWLHHARPGEPSSLF